MSGIDQLVEEEVAAIAERRPRAQKPLISAEEMECRRAIIANAEHESLLEGSARHPETDHLVEAYIRGEIEVTDLVPRAKELFGLR